MLTKLCARCKVMIPYGTTYCDLCADIVRKSKTITDRRYNSRRDPKYAAFYNSTEWHTLRAVKLQQAGYKCEHPGCRALAVEVHHRIPLAVDWSKRLEIDNLEALCLDHHNARHNRFGGGQRNPRGELKSMRPKLK